MITGQHDCMELLISPTALVDELWPRLEQLWKTHRDAKNSEWTERVKGFLGEIAANINHRSQELSLEVIYTKAAPNVHEFLLDVVWWCRRSQEPNEFMALAAEIEWASWWDAPKGAAFAEHIRDCVGEDFGKLTVVKSPLKVMIFCTDNPGPDKSHEPSQQIVLKEIDRYLRSYSHHLPGENYVFIDVATPERMRAWVRSIDSAGVLSPLESLR